MSELILQQKLDKPERFPLKLETGRRIFGSMDAAQKLR